VVEEALATAPAGWGLECPETALAAPLAGDQATAQAGGLPAEGQGRPGGRAGGKEGV